MTRRRRRWATSAHDAAELIARQAGAGAEACGSTGQGGGESVGLVKLAKAAARAPPRRFQVADA
jgi:hypothetical protein